MIGVHLREARGARGVELGAGDGPVVIGVSHREHRCEPALSLSRSLALALAGLRNGHAC